LASFSFRDIFGEDLSAAFEDGENDFDLVRYSLIGCTGESKMISIF